MQHRHEPGGQHTEYRQSTHCNRFDHLGLSLLRTVQRSYGSHDQQKDEYHHHQMDR
jgi:hypothetical protein